MPVLFAYLGVRDFGLHWYAYQKTTGIKNGELCKVFKEMKWTRLCKLSNSRKQHFPLCFVSWKFRTNILITLNPARNKTRRRIIDIYFQCPIRDSRTTRKLQTNGTMFNKQILDCFNSSRGISHVQQNTLSTRPCPIFFFSSFLVWKWSGFK
jgi:hypothetical protein